MFLKTNCVFLSKYGCKIRCYVANREIINCKRIPQDTFAKYFT